MNFKSLAVCVAVLIVGAASMMAQQTEESHAQHKPQLNDNLKCFAPYLGTWVIDAQWSSGDKLWAKNQYEIGLGGNFVVAKTWAKDGDGDVYERYMTIFAWDKVNQKIVSHGFTYDGSVQQVDMEVEMSDGKELIRSQWQPNPANEMVIKQEVLIMDENQYGWKVWSRADESAEFQSLMEGVWKRQSEQ